MTHLITPWTEIAASYKGTILLGNGASMAACSKFGYGSLLGHAHTNGLLEHDVNSLFEFFGTKDFELILRLVWQATNVNKALKIRDDRTSQAYFNVRESLIKAVRAVHPEYADMEKHLPKMYHFLKCFDTVISLNYDLLVYWAITYGLNIYDGHKFKDCFLRDGKFDDSWQRMRKLYKETANTLVFYPHGNLSLCRNSVEIEAKIHASGANLLATILHTWCTGTRVPLFVSEGTMQQKITSIQGSHYLSTVYREVLTSQRSNLTIYGWALGEHDRHILNRMKDTGIKRVAVSVYGSSQAYCNYAYQVIKDELGPVEIDFFDCESPDCWITPKNTNQLVLK